MQSSELNLLNDPSLLLLLQSLQDTANPKFNQENNQPQQEQSFESIFQQVNILQALQELAGLQPKQQVNQENERIQSEEQQQQQTKSQEEKTDSNALSQQVAQPQLINQNIVSSNIIQQEDIQLEKNSNEQQKKETQQILGVDPITTEASLCQEFLNSLVSAATTGSIKTEPLFSQNNPNQPCNNSTTTLPFSTINNIFQDNVSSEMQLFHLLQSCLTIDQIMQAAGAGSCSQQIENTNKEIKHYEPLLLTQQKNAHLLQTPTTSYSGFKSPNDTTNNTRFSASNSKINNNCSNDFNILSSVNANLSAYFNMSAGTADNKFTALSQSPPSIQSGFIPTVLSQNFQLSGFESLDQLAATQLSLQALLASEINNNNPELLRFQQQKRLERQLKIERYKNKRRNWIRKISYDCRKRVADSRLRVKGRFISKKDTQTVKPNCPEDSSFQTDNYAQNSTFSDAPKQNTHPNTPILLNPSNLLLNPLNTNISNKTSPNINLTRAGSFQRLPLLLPTQMDKIKQKIKDKKNIFVLKSSKQSPINGSSFFPTKFPCFIYSEDQRQSSNDINNEVSQQGVPV